MTVTRTPATTLAAVECYRCGGPHFKRNKKTGWVCTAAVAKSSAQSAAVNSNSAAKLAPTDAVAAGLHSLQPQAARSYASAVGSPQNRKSFASLTEKLEAQSALLDKLVAKNKALEERLKLFHQVHFAHIKCRCSDAEPDSATYPKRVFVSATRRLPQDPKPVETSTSAAVAPALYSADGDVASASASVVESKRVTTMTVVEAKKDETKLAKPVVDSKIAAYAAVEASSFAQSREGFVASAAVDAAEIKQESLTKPDSKLVVNSKTATPAAVEAFIQLCPSGTKVSAAVGQSTELKTEDKFVLNLKRDRETSEEEEEGVSSKSSRARKRQRQAANKRARAADFFNLQGNARV